MKKLRNILIVLVSVLPLICNAQTEEEMKWRWYTLVETDITYQSEVENICEDFLVDKNNYIFTDYKYSKEKPEEKEYREITEEIKEISYNRNEISMIEIMSFGNTIQRISELNFYDNNGDIINYKIIRPSSKKVNYELIHDNDETTYVEIDTMTKMLLEFDRVIHIKDVNIVMKYQNNNSEFEGLEFLTYLNAEIFTNAYAPYSTNNNIVCEEDTCILETSIKDDLLYDKDIVIKTKVYNYKDKLYKCYKTEKLYVPGYYTYLENYIKDEEDYIIETNDMLINNTPILNYPFLENYKHLPDIYTLQDISNINDNELILDENKEDTKDNLNENKQISMVVKDKKEQKNKNNKKVYIFLLVLTIILSIPILIKKVKKSRAK